MGQGVLDGGLNQLAQVHMPLRCTLGARVDNDAVGPQQAGEARLKVRLCARLPSRAKNLVSEGWIKRLGEQRARKWDGVDPQQPAVQVVAQVGLEERRHMGAEVAPGGALSRTNLALVLALVLLRHSGVFISVRRRQHHHEAGVGGPLVCRLAPRTRPGWRQVLQTPQVWVRAGLARSQPTRRVTPALGERGNGLLELAGVEMVGHVWAG